MTVRPTRFALSCACIALACMGSVTHADDVVAGKSFFEEQCIACHTAKEGDNGGNQGPSLIGLVGRPAASDKEFTYTPQLKTAKLIWDAATLDRFLAAPDTVVPGTAMVFAVPNKADRDKLLAYFASVSRTAK